MEGSAVDSSHHQNQKIINVPAPKVTKVNTVIHLTWIKMTKTSFNRVDHNNVNNFGLFILWTPIYPSWD